MAKDISRLLISQITCTKHCKFVSVFEVLHLRRDIIERSSASIIVYVEGVITARICKTLSILSVPLFAVTLT